MAIRYSHFCCWRRNLFVRHSGGASDIDGKIIKFYSFKLDLDVYIIIYAK